MPSPLPLQSYDSRILVKENQDTKKKKKSWDHRLHQRFMDYYSQSYISHRIAFLCKFTCEDAKVYNPG